MDPFHHLRRQLNQVIASLVAAGRLPDGLDLARVTVEPPREAGHGDMATNAAMILARPAAMAPREIANMLCEGLQALPEVAAAVVAGPGFVNVRLRDSFWLSQVADILQAGRTYGRSTTGQGQTVNVEYVSVNPTGPLHIGHARVSLVGDVLASLLEATGYRVTREYYVNDAGAQVDALAWATYWRYLEALGAPMDAAAFGALTPTGQLEYQGDYLVPAGQALAAEHGDSLADNRGGSPGPAGAGVWLATVRPFAVAAMMDLIRRDLDELGVRHEVFTSERAIVEAGKVEAACARLEAKGLIYRGVLEPPKGQVPDDWEAREQTLFRATRFGDDVDRPLRKSDGGWTYFAPDIAYHLDKVERGATSLIDVWGADHGGYVKRMQAAVAALTDGAVTLDIKLCQLVRLLDGGEPMRMSKRAGNFVTLRDLVEEVGRDSVRFMMLTRRNDAPLDFDLQKVKEQSRDNPVFYVQYAHARASSVLRHAASEMTAIDLSPAALAAADLTPLTDPAELDLIRQMAGWPRTLEGAAEAHEPHRVPYYLYDLASGFHVLWNKGRDDAGLRFLLPDDVPATRARLALVSALRLVIAAGLEVMGVTAAEEMR
ncbi:MAG: arginine--tRNA ligase [Alphaproteobacteria bacterium]